MYLSLYDCLIKSKLESITMTKHAKERLEERCIYIETFIKNVHDCELTYLKEQNSEIISYRRHIFLVINPKTHVLITAFKRRVYKPGKCKLMDN